MAHKDRIGATSAGPLKRLRRSIASDLRRSPIYRRITLGGPGPSDLSFGLTAFRTPDPARGRGVLDGRFDIGGHVLDAGRAGSPWSAKLASPRFGARLHGFDWLHDVASLGEDGEDAARRLVDSWIERFGAWDDAAWAPAVAAARTRAWLAAADALFDKDDAGADTRLECVARHIRHLDNAAAQAADGVDRLIAVATLAAAGACFEDGEKYRAAGLLRLEEECDRQILVDGGHVSRNPDDVARSLHALRVLEDALDRRGAPTPDAVRRAVDRTAPMLRFFRMSDGGLASFHGGGEGDRDMIEALLDADDIQGRVFEFAPHSGFHRVAPGGGVLVFDVGEPKLPGAPAHASCLAFEFSPPGERLIVNCGWNEDQPERFREPMRLTAAHSTLTLDGKPSLPLNASAKKAAKHDLHAAARRNEEDLGVWIEGSHEGYRQAYGLVHRRRIYIAAKGADIRGEDTLFRPVDAPGSARGKAAPYEIRFHLFPGVRTKIANDGRSVLLTLASGDSWRLRTDSGPLTVEDSLYLAAGAKPRDTKQLVITGSAKPDAPIDRPPNRVRWSLQRLGRASAA